MSTAGIAAAAVLIWLPLTASAAAGEKDGHGQLVCGLAVNDLVPHVRNARAKGDTQENVRAAIEYMAPEGSPDAVLERMRRMTDAIVEALYAVPAEALDREGTKEHAVSVCLTYWLFPQGEAGAQ